MTFSFDCNVCPLTVKHTNKSFSSSISSGIALATDGLYTGGITHPKVGNIGLLKRISHTVMYQEWELECNSLQSPVPSEGLTTLASIISTSRF